MHRLNMNPSKGELNPTNDVDLVSKSEGPLFFEQVGISASETLFTSIAPPHPCVKPYGDGHSDGISQKKGRLQC